jgi:primosomal protein N' (replication factor Y)
MKVANLLLPLPIEHEFSYEITDNLTLKVNDVVKIPFGTRQTFGLVTKIFEEKQDNISGLKPINDATGFSLKPELVEFIEFVSNYNLIPKGMVLKMTLSALKAFTQPKTRKSKSDKIAPKQVGVHLTDEQKTALTTLNNLRHKGFNVSVLEGVTGSGKTEVYLELVKKVVTEGKQVLILLPEILLTTQLIERFLTRLEFPIMEWHSALTPNKRANTWKQVYRGEAKVIVGARSALFLPFNELGLIVVDEEHEPSFKQEDSGCYHARDMAIARAKINNIPIILSSATPSIETEHNIRDLKYHHTFLASRYGKGQMPEIRIIDLVKNKPAKGHWVTSELATQIIDNFKQNKQALLYLNRRGYAMISLCSKCRSKIVCPHCDFNLVKHKSKELLLCHYCGYTENLDVKCKNCGSTERFSDVGPGVERIAEEVATFLPEARIIILSSDTLNTRKKAQNAIEQILNHEVDIIVGTQMITKGLHFPKLDLVGVIDADLSLFSGDIRAFERTYQVLKQVSGRAGRESEGGVVYLQTLEPESYLIESIKNNDWQGFIEYELENRKLANMPPFSRVVMITFSAKNQEALIVVLRTLTKITPDDDNIKFLGPTPAPIFLLKNRFRYRFIIIAEKNINVQKLIKKWLSSISYPKSIEVRIDVDPISFA